jgi:hypothetical protein
MRPPGMAATRETFLQPLRNIRRLFHGFRFALRQPEVQAVTTLALALILLATAFYWLVEGWSLLDAAYFSVVTIATVGFGDIAPVTVLGKLFTIVYVFAGIGIFVAAVTALAQAALRAEPRDDGGYSAAQRDGDRHHRKADPDHRKADPPRPADMPAEGEARGEQQANRDDVRDP